MKLSIGKLVLVKGVYWTDFSHNGKRYRKSTTYTTLLEAVEFAEAMIAQVTQAPAVDAGGEHSFARAIDKYLKKNAGKRDAANDLNKAKIFKAAIGHHDVSEINLEKVDVVIDTLKSNATKNRYLSFAQSVLKLAKEYGWMKEAVSFKKYDEKATQKEVECYMTTEEMKQLIAVLPKPHSQAVAFAWATGRRCSNVYGLKWSEIDFEKKVATTQAKDTKQKSILVTPLTPYAVEVLESMVGFDSVYVFGKDPISWRSWKKALELAGLDTSFRFHGLRHTAATNLLADGNDPYTVQKLMGWKSEVMMRRYEHLDTDQLHALVKPMTYGRRL